jgi:hypothetical protein
MKLDSPFLQLPFRFDADRLAEEVLSIEESAWQPHPQGYAGNSALTLITTFGDPDSNAFAGPMLPTAYLQRCPYLKQVLHKIGGVWGRTRLMRLSGHAEVEPHVDINYYWRERVRVHVPILTQPTVTFYCGEEQRHMAAGECWIFDTWRLHRVVNDATQQRIHLVADTVGSENFWNNVAKSNSGPRNAIPLIEYDAKAELNLRYESVNVPVVMSPWEMRDHFTFLFGELISEPSAQTLYKICLDFSRRWQALYIENGEKEEALSLYQLEANQFLVKIEPFTELRMKNNYRMTDAIRTIIVSACCFGRSQANFVEERGAGQASVNAAPVDNPALRKVGKIKHPIMILSTPRSGSTMLFEALSKAEGICTIGGESHGIIEAIQPLHPSSKQFASNQLDATDATADVIRLLNTDFRLAAKDINGKAYRDSEDMKILEKTPKNLLRVPFFEIAFDQPHYIYLYREPKEVISSMLDAWKSGRFRTYPDLPGWQGIPWSLLLVPGWQGVNGAEIPEIVAHQWKASTEILINSLNQIPRDRITKVRYSAFKKSSSAVKNLCQLLNLHIQNVPDELPLSRFTLTPPREEKWRQHEKEIEVIWPMIENTTRMAEGFMSDAEIN